MKSFSEKEYLVTLGKLMNLTACIYDSYSGIKKQFSSTRRQFFKPVGKSMHNYNFKCIFNTDYCEDIVHHHVSLIVKRSRKVSVSIEHGTLNHFRSSKYDFSCEIPDKWRSDSITDYVVDLEAFFLLISSKL